MAAKRSSASRVRAKSPSSLRATGAGHHGPSSKAVTLTKARAKKAATAAKKFYSGKASKAPTVWKKGGREWSRVLGHFGITG